MATAERGGLLCPSLSHAFSTSTQMVYVFEQGGSGLVERASRADCGNAPATINVGVSSSSIDAE